MKTEWDYTALANAYLERPNYAADLLEKLFIIAGLKEGDKVCDIGAGVAHLTIPLGLKGYNVDAIEPNDAMRANGIKRTESMPNINWYEGTGEETGRESEAYDFASFGSSFNVCDRAKALNEVYRILKPGKWFTCMWNHRQLDDPIQQEIESIIKSYIEDYTYGTRREDQSKVIAASGLFHNIQEHTGTVIHTQKVEKAVEAWRSHGTLHRQAGSNFDKIIENIQSYLASLGVDKIEIPYTTRSWIAQKQN